MKSRAGKRVLTLPRPLVEALRAHRTALLEVPARVVMEMLGHSSYQLTVNTCSHVAPELNSEAARLMAGELWDSDDPPTSGPIRRQPP